MCDTASFWNILIAEMPVELPCTALGCQHGDGGGPYKTPALEVEYALKMLDSDLRPNNTQKLVVGKSSGALKPPP